MLNDSARPIRQAQINIVPASPGFHVLTPVIDFQNDFHVKAVDSEPVLAWRIETDALAVGGLSSSAVPVCVHFDESLPQCEIFAIEWPSGEIRDRAIFRFRSREELLAHWQDDPCGVSRDWKATHAEVKASPTKQ